LDIYLGIDVGSVTTKLVALDDNCSLIHYIYRPTKGDPLVALKNGLSEMEMLLSPGTHICGVATTGSGRHLAGVIIGADLVKNEITSQASATLHYFPEARTVIEIGGQDSKMIFIRECHAAEFAMNTVCAAGTGGFLDHQAKRLNLSLYEFSQRALISQNPVAISGRCTVFAESDMVHKQQMGHSTEDIIYGLCRRLVKNYLSDVSLAKDINPPIVFQGGVAFNRGIVKALEEELKTKLIVPRHPEIMGAIGAALLIREDMFNNIGPEHSRFKGFKTASIDHRISPSECRECAIHCQVTQLSLGGQNAARWGGVCDLWQEYPVINNEETDENCS
jgi:predicted CoA-substrate-specific enzyme activase